MAELAGTRVLLIEDEAMVAILIEDMLEDLGCELVASVASVSRAAEAVRAAGLDLAVLDINIGGQMTFPLADILVERQIPFIFSTGYGEAGLPPHLRDRPVIRKPFRISDLRNAVLQALAA